MMHGHGHDGYERDSELVFLIHFQSPFSSNGLHLDVNEMIKLRLMCGVTRKGNIKNE